MAIIVGIKFRGTGKMYYFDPTDITFEEHDHAIVETARGLEYAEVVLGNREVPDKEVVQPLKPVVRKATPEDDARAAKNLADRDDALAVIRRKAEELGLDMKPVDAEYTFDRGKLIFYFTAAGRVDFRELVRALASIFKVLPDFEKVSIKMAKVQGLSLNPQKISGVCGRLMCCLKYENDYYAKASKEMPKVGGRVRTKDGEGVVESNDLLRKTSRVRIATKDGSYDVRTYELADMKFGADRGGKREEADEPGDDEE